MRGQVIYLFVVLAIVWILATMTTDTPNPVDQFQRLLAAADDLLGATRLTHATDADAETIADTPEALAAEASQTLGQSITVEEYTLARMLRCERTVAHRGGNDAEGAAIVWVALNDANAHNGGDIIACVTGGHGFGKQGHLRKYATMLNDPYDRDLDLVRRCRSGEIPDPTAGATHFMHEAGFKSPELYQEKVKEWAGYGWAVTGKNYGTSLETWT